MSVAYVVERESLLAIATVTETSSTRSAYVVEIVKRTLILMEYVTTWTNA